MKHWECHMLFLLEKQAVFKSLWAKRLSASVFVEENILASKITSFYNICTVVLPVEGAGLF